MSKKINRACSIATIAIVCCMVFAPIATCTAATVTVTGHVFLEYQKNHAGVLVEFQPGSAPAVYASTTTDSAGHFAVTLNSPAGYTLALSKLGYYAFPTQQVYAFTDTTLATLNLYKQPTQLAAGYQRAVHLRRADSPYEVSNLILECDTLTLEAGCRLRLMCYGTATTPPGIIINHVLEAQGFANDSIFITQAPSCPDSAWLPGILVRGTRSEFAYANTGVSFLALPSGPTATIAVDHSMLSSITNIDSTVQVEVDNSDAVVDGERVSLESVRDCRVRTTYSESTLLVGGTALRSTLQSATLHSLPQSHVDACSLSAETIEIAGEVDDSWVNPSVRLAFSEGSHLRRSTVWGPHTVGHWVSVDSVRGSTLDSNHFALEANAPNFGRLTLLDGTIARSNTFGLCPAGDPFDPQGTPGSVIVGRGALFTDNDCFRATLKIDSGGVATGNLVYQLPSYPYGVNITVGDYGTAVNNLSFGADAGFYAYPFATVHHNAAFDAVRYNFSGIPILGVNTQVNANGDSCDAFFNLSGPLIDPGVSIDADQCLAPMPECSSPLLNAGSVAFGSRNIGFPDDVCDDVNEISDEVIPSEFELGQNYPNPFNATTDFTFTIAKSSHIRVEIINALGQTLTTLADTDMGAGKYRATWDGTDADAHSAATGIYFYRVTAGSQSLTKKMVLLK